MDSSHIALRRAWRIYAVTSAACRLCTAPLDDVFVDLGMSPLANAYLMPEEANRMEPFYPLRALVCSACLLVQVEAYETPDRIFGEYAYFSSYSSSWLAHSRRYVKQMMDLLQLNPSSLVVELASNDGYLLQYFAEHRIPVLGIEPARNVAKVALQKGVPTLVEFFGEATARSVAAESQADLLVGNNVLAHVPDLHDFVGGMKILLKPTGLITMELTHLLQLMIGKQWDTIYHEHFSYFSLATVSRVLEAHGLLLFDVEELPTHGGSLRIYACHVDDRERKVSERVLALMQREHEAGLSDVATYTRYGTQVAEDKFQALEQLIGVKRAGKRLVGYGAPAKGNVFLNYCGIGTDVVEYTCDANPHKQGRLLPGSHIPVRPPDALREDQPDVILILPWNLKDEIVSQLSFVREWGGQFAVRTPDLQVY